MAKYSVTFQRVSQVDIEVEAKSSDDAEKKAEAKLASIVEGAWEELEMSIEGVDLVEGDEEDEDEE